MRTSARERPFDSPVSLTCSPLFFHTNSIQQSIREKNGVKRNQIRPWYSVISMIRCKFIQPNVWDITYSWHVRIRRPPEKNHRIKVSNMHIYTSRIFGPFQIVTLIFSNFIFVVGNRKFSDKNQFGRLNSWNIQLNSKRKCS